jgi:hypothetical protein
MSSPGKLLQATLLLHALSITSACPIDIQSAPLKREAPPSQFTANPNIGPGGSTYKDSAHFRVYGQSGGNADAALNMLEGAYDCFINVLGFRSTGLSYNANNENGPWTKVNIYSVATLPGAAGVMHSDYATGMAWLEVQNNYITTPGVVVHEFGHGVHYHQQTWVDQGRTGAWWETFANWFADTYKTSSICAASRSKFGQSTGTSEISVHETIGESFRTIVDGTVGTGNWYEAWPFFTYLTNNPDNFPNLGRDTMRQLMVQYSRGSNETPLHTLQRVAGGTQVARIIGRYWAHMANLDIGHPNAQQIFLQEKSRINFANVDSTGNNAYRVKSARRPFYMGSNIIPLKANANTISVQITSNSSPYTATLAVFNSGTKVARYIDVVGSGSVTLSSGEAASLVVANTPAQLLLYDPFNLPSQTPLDYSFTLTGATV